MISEVMTRADLSVPIFLSLATPVAIPEVWFPSVHLMP